MRSRLQAALALALVLALVTAAGSIFRSSQQILGQTSPSASAALSDDDGGYGAVALAPQPLLGAAVFFALALVALAAASPGGACASEPRRARAPPSH